MPANVDRRSSLQEDGWRNSTKSQSSSVVAKLAARSRPTTSRRSAQNANAENDHPNLATSRGRFSRKSPRLNHCCSQMPLAASNQASSLADITNVVSAASAQATKVDRAKIMRAAPQVRPTFRPIHDEAPTTKPVLADVEQVNVQDVKEYAPDVESHLFIDEVAFLPRPNYMDTQQDLSSKMRMILVDWLIEVHMKYGMRNETLHLTINLIDRYLSFKAVSRKRLQLVGITATLIASKYEEIHPPEVRELVHITDNAYSKDELLQTEVGMLSVLGFQIMVPTAAHFFDFLQKANGCDEMHRMVAQYIIELGLLDIRMLHHTPSHVVSAALLLSNQLLKRKLTWPPTMVQRSRHSETSLAGCVTYLRQLLEADQEGAGGQLCAVHKKFAAPERRSVSKRAF
mmetsp:Transcript_78541/g.123796  ORF Transcript_78541/g.123796 Transcript_78541/m.123796 type:complete len:400 (+) Transcript_78541:68-1267(+)